MSGAGSAAVNAAGVSFVAAAVSPPSDSSLSLRRTLIRRIDSMSDSLCLSTLQLFLALVRTRDEAVIDCLIDNPVDSTAAAGAALSPSPSLDSLALQFDGLGHIRTHPDFADTLVDVQRQRHMHSTIDTATPLSLSLPLHPPSATVRAVSEQPPIVHLSAAALSSADRSMFASVSLNKLDGWLDSSHHSTNLLLSSLLAALACDRRPHVQLLIVGRQRAVPVAGADIDHSVLSSVVRLWRNGRRREHRIPNLNPRLAACKAAMSAHLSSAASDSIAGTSGPAAADSVDVQRFMRLWLMLEAVVIELGAIQYCEQANTAIASRSPLTSLTGM